VRAAVELTRQNTGLILNVAFNYGARAEIARAVQRLVLDGVPAEAVSPELIDGYLDTAGLPDPDLIIRTGGEMRLSNFLLWQAAYAEYYSSPVCWPDFGRDELYEAFRDYGRRVRRFGGVT
jgi:undecaprenyl diphosphate synthase